MQISPIQNPHFTRLMSSLLLLSDDNRILGKRSNLRVCFPRARQILSGANKAKVTARWHGGFTDVVLKDSDDAGSISTTHLKYLGNGVWIGKKQSSAIV